MVVRGRWLMWGLLLPALAHAQATVDEAAPAPSAAEVDTEARERARAEFRAGVALARSGLHAESCAAFERSLELLPHASTLYNLAQSELSLGHGAAARYHLRRALNRDAAGAELAPALKAKAAQRVDALDAELVQLVVSLPVSDVVVAVDGHPVWVEEEGEAPRLTPRPRSSGSTLVPGRSWLLIVDAGRHTIEIRHADRRDALELNEPPGARVMWAAERFTGLAPAVVVPPPVVVAPGALAPRRVPAPSPLSPSPSPSRPASHALPALETAAWVLAGVGVASTVVFGSMALHERGELADACPDPSRCPAGTDVVGRRQKIERFAMAADIGLIAAALGLGSGITLRMTSGHGAAAQVAGHF